MARIVKSIAVVDDRRQHDEEGGRQLVDLRLVDKTVLKGGVLGSYGVPFHNPNAPVTHDSARDELNRMLAQVEEAKAELRSVHREIEEAHEEYEAFQQSRDDADLLDDELYQQRKQELQQGQEQARREIEELRSEAEAEAKSQAEKARGTGYHEGYASGYQAAEDAFRQEAVPEMEAKMREVAGLIEHISSFGEELYREKEREFVSLVVAIAGKILQREIKTDPDTIVDMLHEILSRNHREVYVNLTMSPDMLPTGAKAQEDIINRLTEQVPGLNVYIEKEMGEGVLYVETPKGVTDMGLDTQLRNINENLLEEEV
ncbi:hypothetical protein LJC63_01455 [Ruminococcaceae bacterium OttesenSCG-928-L11]|nr:hypothetical protein [Ruminococcaceae bacterium OttesenSCG-928-L11]